MQTFDTETFHINRGIIPILRCNVKINIENLKILKKINIISNSRKQYKAETNKAFEKYKKDTITKLRKLQTESPK